MLGINKYSVIPGTEKTSVFWAEDAANAGLSSEFSVLIQQAGRWCESYASDILIDIDSVKAYLIGMGEGMEKPEDREFWFGFREMGVDGLTFIEARTERVYASMVYRAVWHWEFTVEETEGDLGPRIHSRLERLSII